MRAAHERRQDERSRESAGMTPAEAARRLGKRQAFVWKSEVGERRVDVIELKQFAELYGVPIAFFYK